MPQLTLVPVKVWDLPVRVFHWLIVVLLVFQVVTGKIGGDLMGIHAFCGNSVLVLVVFRVLWGFAGSTHARFASFIASPGAALRFGKRLFSRQAVPQVGHNPLGGWSVVAMILVLGLQALSGLFANDGAEFGGPLAALVSLDVSNRLTEFHRWNLKLLLLLSGLHVAAVLFHWLVKKDGVLGSMFTGIKEVPESAVHERRAVMRSTPLRRILSREQAFAHFASPWRALALFAVAIAFVWLVVHGLRW
jgi:cytochrome b